MTWEEKVKTSKRLQGQEHRREAFQKSTGKTAYSPALVSKRSQVRAWADQGWTLEKILAAVNGGATREELERFMSENGIALKRIRSNKGDSVS